MRDGTRESRYDTGSSGSSDSPDSAGRQPLSHAEREFARELFEDHRLSLYRYLNGLLHSREEASEILQETYLRLLRQPSFEHIRSNARAYLFQTATNLARDLFRHRAVRGIDAEKRAHSLSSLHAQDWTNLPDLALEGDQVAYLIVDALKELSSCVREALLLYRFRDMTHREIAVRMGLSTRTVERYIKEGLEHIERRLEAVL
ncbi:MAG TPA: sigma-70 family RNA polymerase sigma factor [Steroidobacteraceae bacterium]|jgi:RNA polymerase sigma-70 factor (ECF subfamily)